MKNSWTQTFRRLAAGAVVAGTTAISSAMCYAQLAYDDASDGAYLDGWQDGDDGGFGFSPWDFSSSITFGGTYYGQYTDSGFHAIDDGLQAGTHYSNPFNAIGRAWDIGISPTNNGVPRAGRGFKPLEINQKLKVLIDNPTERAFFKGYFVRLNSASRSNLNGEGIDGNICYGGYACTDPFTNAVLPQMNFSRFEYFNNGEWRVEDAGSTATGVFDTDTAAAGALLSVKRTGLNSYEVRMNSLGGGTDYIATGHAVSNPGSPVNWLELTFFNTPTDTGTPPTTATDLYIRSVCIVPEPGTMGLFVLGAGTLLGIGTARRRRE